jgi:hypothetical protein
MLSTLPRNVGPQRFLAILASPSEGNKTVVVELSCENISQNRRLASRFDFCILSVFDRLFVDIFEPEFSTPQSAVGGSSMLMRDSRFCNDFCVNCVILEMMSLILVGYELYILRVPPRVVVFIGLMATLYGSSAVQRENASAWKLSRCR